MSNTPVNNYYLLQFLHREIYVYDETHAKSYETASVFLDTNLMRGLSIFFFHILPALLGKEAHRK